MSVLSPILIPPEIKEYMTKGERFIKWDDDSTNASPVILRVDSRGFYLYWTFQSKEMEFLDITSIRDTRVGKFAKIPKSQKLREVFNLDFPDNNFFLKTLTVVSGPDMVDLTFHNFVSYKENVGKNWADDILAIVRNPFTYNACRYTFLEKILVKLKMQLNNQGKIPVRNIFQMFPADRKRVEAALNACHLPIGKNDGINPEDFPESVYKTFLMNLCPRPEIDEIFTSHHSKAKPYMTKDHLTKFINKKQRDSHLNDMLFPPAKPQQVQGLIDKYEPSGMNIQRGQLSPEGMVWFLCGPENSIVSQEKLLLYQDMSQPLSHYFINSSHNTYLTAGQFSGISSPEMYRQSLLMGCRCVELDCWKGRPPDEEPIITHGFTMTSEILFKDAIEAIAESAFKTSPYPVILSFENHVDSPKQQAKMAEYCRTIFGDMLLTEPLENFPLKPGVPLPSPQDLMGKILIKNKKNQFGENQDTQKKGKSPEEEASGSDQPTSSDGENTDRACEAAEEVPELEEDLGNLDEEEIKKLQSDEGTAGLEVTAYEEMSSLVNYIQPIKFESFEISARCGMSRTGNLFKQMMAKFAATKTLAGGGFFKGLMLLQSFHLVCGKYIENGSVKILSHPEKNRSYVVSSFTEIKAYELLTKSPIQFVDYNKRQMSRIYPKGTRMDSSNYMPQMFWNVGCQMVALNFQTTDVPMQQNTALFEFNGQSGYLLKHAFMRRPDKQFDPFSVDRIDVVVASTLSITIISGQFLSERSVRSYVEVELFGLPGDPKRRYRTKLTPNANSINPVWKEDAFVFEKILMPELASLRIVALEEGGKFIGHRIIPITAVRTGYHHVCLRSESNMPLTMPSLFVYVEMKDYVPDSWADLTMALSNPIKFFNAHDKKSLKSQEANAEQSDPQVSRSTASLSTTNGLATITGTYSRPPSNGPAGTLTTGKEEPKNNQGKRNTEPQTASMEELQQAKAFGKLLKRQEKELKELERKAMKRREELLQKYDILFTELVGQPGKKKGPGPPKAPRKKSCRLAMDESRSPGEAAESSDGRILELKEKLEEELIQLGEEQYDGIRKKKEQHVTEQIAKIIELAREKQASELKALKESSESSTKEMKKNLEAKRVDKIQTMAKNTTDKGAQERLKREINNAHIQEVVQAVKQMNETQNRYQQLLEAKQTASLEKIKEKEHELQQEAFAEYEEKVKALSAEVQELVKSCAKVCFPLEADKAKEEALDATSEGDQVLPEELQQNNLTPEAVGHETENGAEGDELIGHQVSRL